MGKTSEHGVKRPGAQHRQPLRHTDGAFDADEYAAFFLGVTVPCRSSNVESAWYDEEEQRLYVQFKDGSLYSSEADDHLVESFARASSKGGWIWAHWRWPNKEVLRVI